jgi:hypothetical protein
VESEVIVFELLLVAMMKGLDEEDGIGNSNNDDNDNGNCGSDGGMVPVAINDTNNSSPLRMDTIVVVDIPVDMERWSGFLWFLLLLLLLRNNAVDVSNADIAITMRNVVVVMIEPSQSYTDPNDIDDDDDDDDVDNDVTKEDDDDFVSETSIIDDEVDEIDEDAMISSISELDCEDSNNNDDRS